ncbi:MAG: TIGR02594 family protein [Armatimonadota bacterium]
MNTASTSLTPASWVRQQIGDRPIDWHTFQKLFAYAPAARERNGWTVAAMRAVRAALLDRLRDAGYDISRLPYQQLVDGKTTVTEVTPPTRRGPAPSTADAAAPEAETTSAPAPATSTPKTDKTPGGLPVPETLARSLYRTTDEVLRRALALEQQRDFDGARKLVAPQIAKIKAALPQLQQDANPQANREIIAYLQDKLDRYDRGTLPGSPAQPGVTAHRYHNTTVPLPAAPAVTAPKPGGTTPRPGAATPRLEEELLTPQKWVARQIGTRTLTWQDFVKQMGYTHKAWDDYDWSEDQLHSVRKQIIDRLEQSGYDLTGFPRKDLIEGNIAANDPDLKVPPRRKTTSGTPSAGYPWVATAQRQLGIHEIPGKQSESEVIKYLHATSNTDEAARNTDSTAWCSAFVNWVLQQHGLTGTQNALASSWLKWGDPADRNHLVPGTIVVFDHHVAILERELGNGRILVIGGNQSRGKNQPQGVTESRRSKSEVIDYRIPPPGRAYSMTPKGAVSTPALRGVATGSTSGAATGATARTSGNTPAKPAPRNYPVPPMSSGGKRLSEDQLRTVAQNEGLDYPALRAVAEVESGGYGYMPDGRIKILFERHWLWRQLKTRGIDPAPLRRYDENLCYPVYVKGFKYGSGADQYVRVQRVIDWARKHDPAHWESYKKAAYESCSWGKFQQLGLHYQEAGYPNVYAFKHALEQSEANQLTAILRWMKTNGLFARLQGHHWQQFVTGYNGDQNVAVYTAKLKKAYRQFGGE